MKEWTSAAWMVGNLLFVFRVALLSLTIQATRVNSPLRTEYRREYSRVKVEFPPPAYSPHQLHLQRHSPQIKITHAFDLPAPSSSVNRKLTLFTQCLSSVGVGYPSPLNTCPRCPPQLLHTISVRSIPNELSVYRLTAPGTESKYAGQPQPDLNLWEAL